MRLVADESVDGPIVAALRADGHGVTYVAELDPGIVDSEVLALAHRHEAPLLTCDSDFGELVYRQMQAHSGVALLRLAGLDSDEKARITVGMIRVHGDALNGAFAVLTPTFLRIRSAPQ